MPGPGAPLLTIVADDYGYATAYDAGIEEALAAGAIDGVGVMALRVLDAKRLAALAQEREAELGLHLEPVERASLEDQLEAFRAVTGADPAYLDGHHHCHAGRDVAHEVAALAQGLGIVARAVDEEHRALIRGAGVGCADRLLGRLSEEEPALPPEIGEWLSGRDAPAAVRLVEWMTHPGRRDRSTGSSYDRGREEDLELLLSLGDRAAWRARGVTRVVPGHARTLKKL